jgi:hypothetical protein
MISLTRTPTLAASIAMLISVCGFSPGITGNSGIPITVTAGHDSESPVALRRMDRFRKGVNRIFTEEEPKCPAAFKPQ